MPIHPQKKTAIDDTPAQRLFACAFGSLLGLSLLKFGNPVLMNDLVSTPTNLFEWVLTAWPLAIGQVLLALVAIMGLWVARKPQALPRWLIFLPLPWLAWQLIASAGSVDRALSIPILIHFATNLVCFYLGLFCLGPIRDLKWFWTGLCTGFLLVLLSGWQQHFGGLEATQEYFFTQIYSNLNGEVSDTLLKKMSSPRIFATLFYPNTLAGAVLLLAPVSVAVFPRIFRNGSAQRIGSMLTLALAFGCLFWSGSKAGWLLMLGLGLVALFRLRFSCTIKVVIALVVIVGGLTGFLWKYSGYLQKGAQSAVARLDYWEAALKITRAHPLTGTGPGTFGKSYAEVKRPESEMAKLTHNDFLEQACDSGIPGFVFFTGFIGVTMVYLGLRVWRSGDGPQFWIWLGLLGVVLQSLVEFGWYIPAIAWPTTALMGWLLGSQTNGLDNLNHQNLTSGPYEGARSERPKPKSARPTRT